MKLCLCCERLHAALIVPPAIAFAKLVGLPVFGDLDGLLFSFVHIGSKLCLGRSEPASVHLADWPSALPSMVQCLPVFGDIDGLLFGFVHIGSKLCLGRSEPASVHLADWPSALPSVVQSRILHSPMNAIW